MLTMSAILNRAATIFGRRTAMINPSTDGRMSEPARETRWADHVIRARRIAGGLGLKPGMRIAIIARNSVGQAELFHAGYIAGACPVPVNWRLSPPEIAAVLTDCDPDLVLVDGEFAGLAAEQALARWLRHAIILHNGRLADDRLGDTAPFHGPDTDDAALILYTGGTTGRPKGVRLSHGNITANAFQLISALAMAEDTRYLHIAPMFHGADLIGTAATLLGGAHAYLSAFTVENLLQATQAGRISHTMLVPAMVRQLVDHPATAGTGRMQTLKHVIYGSSPMDAALITAACRALPRVGWRQGYGLTETGPLISILGAAEHRSIASGGNIGLAASAGRPLPGVVSRIADAAGKFLPPGAVGEVLVQGPNISPGYFRNEAETAAAFINGWFRTGDIGRFDDDGYLYLLDRAKDMIISGGENIYCIEVEDALLAHPGVAEAAVIGQPDPEWGEVVTAIIVARDPALTDTELRAHCRTKLGGYKVPRRFRFMADLPRNALGKVMKQQLRGM